MHAALLQADFSSAVQPANPPPYAPAVEVLADRISLHIESLVPRGRVQCLDVGSDDTAIADTIHERLARTHWRHVAVDAAGPAAPLHSPDDDSMPFNDGEFDVAVVNDVLRDDPERGAQLLSEAARVARYVLVKDRFERESYARTNARLTREAFIDLANRQGLVITAFDSGLALHERSPASPQHVQPGSSFVAVLCRGAHQAN